MTTRYKGRITAAGARRLRIAEGTLVEFTVNPQQHPDNYRSARDVFVNGSRVGGGVSLCGDDAPGIEPLEPLPWEAHS